jgi:S-formylglutathione hydrolase FrmB
MAALVVGVLAATAAASVARAHHADRHTSRIVELTFPSKALQRRLHFVAYLPRRYETGRERYAVVYFLHGLPTAPDAYRGAGWLRPALDSLSRPAILVAPQGSAHGDSDPEYLDRGPGRNWETAIARELPRFVDSHLRTLPRRDARALVGLSAGGYGAVALGLHHLDDFAAIESWSGYFRPTNPAGTRTLDLGSTSRNARADAHAFVATLKRDLKRRPTFFAFYVGSEDRRFRAENFRLDRELGAAQVPHVFAIYPGAHEATVWSAHARAWLELAVRRLAAPRP